MPPRRTGSPLFDRCRRSFLAEGRGVSARLRGVTTTVRPAEVDDVPSLAALLARAFVDDPIMRWTTPADDREARVAAFFEAFDRYTAARGWLWTPDGGAGAALWVPPGTEAEFEELTFALDGDRDLLGDAAERYDSFWAWAEGKRPSAPHWYLDHLAVERERRGSGLGVALVEHGLALADADGMPAFLCTARADNVPFYERRGFALVEVGDAPDGGPRVWFLSREPNAGTGVGSAT
jgi:ribosomal protein S18 acetylase RimI-like enzyme